MSLAPDDLKKLKAKFDDTRLGVKVQSLSRDKSKAMLVLYLQHTDVADRLEEVDPAWSFEVRGESRYGDIFVVHGRLTIKGVSRENAGEGNDPKSAYSDAFKRCAMLFGVGRYLYDSELVWVPYDEQRDRYKQWSPEEYWKWVKPEPALRAAAKSAAPAIKPNATVAPARTPAVKPKTRIAAIAAEPEPDFEGSQDAMPFESRDDLNRKLMALYRPYLTKFPQTRFNELLYGRYNVNETRLMTVEQCRDLIHFMEQQLAAPLEPGSEG